MNRFNGQKVLVAGLDPSGIAACRLLRQGGATVLAAGADSGTLTKAQAAELAAEGIKLAGDKELAGAFDLCVHSSHVSRHHPLAAGIAARGVPVISDLELAASGIFCLSLAITGTNGKTTTAELAAAMLAGALRKTVRAGASGAPVCSILEQSRELDFVTLDLNSFQLESISEFRPAVAVVTNLRGDHMDRYANLAEYARVVGRVFQKQLAFDWAIVQSEALAHLRSLDIPIPSKVITFSARHRRADLYLDRGLLISSMADWSGPLFNMEHGSLRGPDNAENIMAALAVGRVLKLPLEAMTAALREYRPGPHRLELVAEIRGVKFINNSKAMNVDAVRQSIEAIAEGRAGDPNVWLIAGGLDKALEYHDLGPLLARRVKGAFLLGQSREKLRAAWSLFTPCSTVDSLLEGVSRAAESAGEGDVVLLSPACSSFDMFQSYQHRGETFREAVQSLRQASDMKDAPQAGENPRPAR